MNFFGVRGFPVSVVDFSTMLNGIVVGCDRNQEWLLSWWWGHYSAHNSLPVAFVDMGLTEEGITWCKNHGQYINLPEVPYKEPPKLKSWERRYGEDLWQVRPAWLKKPFACLQSPFEASLWCDLDTQINGSLEPLFLALSLSKGELALVRDENQHSEFLLPNEVYYNSGVMAFRKGAAFLRQWIDLFDQFDLPGDQQYLSRSIHLHNTAVLELPPIYNWALSWGPNENAVIFHYLGGSGKIEILQAIQLACFTKAN